MGIPLACPCGEVYELKPQYAGRLLECPTCGRHLRAGHVPGGLHIAALDVDPAFEREVFLLRERAFTIRTKYEVCSQAGTPLLFVERPTYPVRTLLAYLAALLAAGCVGIAGHLAGGEVGELGGLVELGGYALMPAVFVIVSMSLRPRRHVSVYRSERRREVMLRVLQDQRAAFLTRTYTVLAGGGEMLARLRKNYAHNAFRKRWYVETPAGRCEAVAVEDSVVLSLLRRVLGPLFGVLRTNFVLLGAAGTVIGEFNRKFTLLDRYVLDLRGDPDRELDRRVALALGIMLDTGERR